jgi:hypothetical protein
MLILFAGRTACALISVQSTGFHSLILSRTDVVSLDLPDKFAVFLDIPSDSFTAEFREAAASIPAFFPLSLSAFTIRGGSLKLVCRVRRARLNFWLLSEYHCPEAMNIAIVNTDSVMHLETGLNGTICLFFHTGAYLYDVQVETGLGFPWINFFSCRGRGDVVRLCQGEEEPCALSAPDLVFMSIRGPTRVNFSYSVRGFEPKAFHCSIDGLPMVANGSFVDTVPQIDNVAHPWCLSENSGLFQSGRMIGVVGFVIASFGILGRIIVRRGRFKSHGFIHWRVAIRIRKNFENC